jgi:hypothetical protein
MKKFLGGLALAGSALAVPGMALADDDVWSAATTAVTTASTNCTSLLILAIGISVAFVGYKVAKRVMARV